MQSILPWLEEVMTIFTWVMMKKTLTSVHFWWFSLFHALSGHQHHAHCAGGSFFRSVVGELWMTHSIANLTDNNHGVFLFESDWFWVSMNWSANLNRSSNTWSRIFRAIFIVWCSISWQHHFLNKKALHSFLEHECCHHGRSHNFTLNFECQFSLPWHELSSAPWTGYWCWSCASSSSPLFSRSVVVLSRAPPSSSLFSIHIACSSCTTLQYK